MLFMKIFSCLSIPAEELDGCDDPELPMKLHVKQWVAFYNNLDRKVSMIALQKQVGCFNHRVVTMVADKLETERFTLVWETNWIRQPKKQLPSFSYIITIQ